MRIGVPAETKTAEYRVALTPAGAHELSRAGHQVLVQADAGAGSRLPDADYRSAGATLVAEAGEAWAADLVLKVKEPTPQEYRYLRPGLVLFTYLHLAADRRCTEALLGSGTVGIGYETVELADGSLPLLTPMSEVAGRMAPQVAASLLERERGGRGVLISGVSGVHAARIVVLGAGVAGSNAAAIAVGLHAEVTVLDRDVTRLRALDAIYRGHLQTVTSNRHEVARAVSEADAVIGAVLVHGARTPVLVDDEMVAGMLPGSVIVDISVDQGGCVAGARPTTHEAPTFPIHDSVFYGVANMPGAVPHTSTFALTNATLPYVVELAGRGWQDAVSRNPALRAGVNTAAGALVSPPVADAHGLPVTPPEEVLRRGGNGVG